MTPTQDHIKNVLVRVSSVTDELLKRAIDTFFLGDSDRDKACKIALLKNYFVFAFFQYWKMMNAKRVEGFTLNHNVVFEQKDFVEKYLRYSLSPDTVYMVMSQASVEEIKAHACLLKCMECAGINPGLISSILGLNGTSVSLAQFDLTDVAIPFDLQPFVPVPGGGSSISKSDFGITKVFDLKSPSFIGAIVAYDITVINYGPDAGIPVVTDVISTSFSVNDILCTHPSGLFSISQSQLENGWAPPIGLQTGQSMTIRITGSYIETGSYINSAEVQPTIDTIDTNQSNNVATTTGLTIELPPPPVTDFSVVKTCSASSVVVNIPVTYTLTITNNGPDAGMAFIQDIFNITGFTVTAITSTTPTVPTITELENEWPLPEMAAGEEHVITITGYFANAGTYLNDAIVSVPSPNVDLVSGNNVSSHALTVTGLTTDFTVTKTVSTLTALVGEVVTYTISITNNGSIPARPFVTDVLPIDGSGNTAFVWGGSSGFTTGGSAGFVSLPNLVSGWTGPILAPGQTMIIIFNGSFINSGSLRNRVTVTTTDGIVDSNPGNNTVYSPYTTVTPLNSNFKLSGPATVTGSTNGDKHLLLNSLGQTEDIRITLEYANHDTSGTVIPQAYIKTIVPAGFFPLDVWESPTPNSTGPTPGLSWPIDMATLTSPSGWPTPTNMLRGSGNKRYIEITGVFTAINGYFNFPSDQSIDFTITPFSGVIDSPTGGKSKSTIAMVHPPIEARYIRIYLVRDGSASAVIPDSVFLNGMNLTPIGTGQATQSAYDSFNDTRSISRRFLVRNLPRWQNGFNYQNNTLRTLAWAPTAGYTDWSLQFFFHVTLNGSGTEIGTRGYEFIQTINLNGLPKLDLNGMIGGFAYQTLASRPTSVLLKDLGLSSASVNAIIQSLGVADNPGTGALKLNGILDLSNSIGSARPNSPRTAASDTEYNLLIANGWIVILP